MTHTGASSSSSSSGSSHVNNNNNNNNVHELFTTATPALVSGAVQAVLFNPFDRALYVRVQTRRRRFLDWRNFEHPFQGFANAAVYRTIVGASYIFWQDSCRFWIPRIAPSWFRSESDHPVAFAILVGLVAGAVNGLALNNLQAVKFRMWADANAAPSPGPAAATGTPATGVAAAMGNGRQRGFLGTAAHMYATGGVRVFFRGCVVTMMRDSVFGVVYEGLRRSSVLRHCVQWVGGCNRPRHRDHDSIDSKNAEAAPLAFSSSSTPSPPPMQPPLASTRAVPVTVARKNKRPEGGTKPPGLDMVSFFCNLIAAVCATVASSPLNYIRSVAYSTPVHAASLHRWTLLRSLVIQAAYCIKYGDSYRRITYHAAPALSPLGDGWHLTAGWQSLNRRLNIGWGSLRVGLGMAVGQLVFAHVQEAMKA